MRKFVLLLLVFFSFVGFSTHKQDRGCLICSRIIYFKNGNVLRVDSVSYVVINGVEMVETFNFEYSPPKKKTYPFSQLADVQYSDSIINKLAKNLYK